MEDHHEIALLTYLQLAVISHDKKQFNGRNKLLVLAAREACRAGLMQYAEPCRELILANNPQHALSNYGDFVEAVRSEDFQALLDRLEKQMPFEKAEYLLEAQGESFKEKNEEVSPLIERLVSRMKQD